jgi:hypothetical protein
VVSRGCTRSGLSRRRSRVRVPSLPLSNRLEQVLALADPEQFRRRVQEVGNPNQISVWNIEDWKWKS